MSDFVSDWAGAGLTEVTLPSGRQVRLRLPEPRDLIVRGLLPTELVQAVLEQPDSNWSNVAEEDPDLAAKLFESMKVLAADAIRQGRKSDADEWQPITVPVATYLLLPDPDRELIEALIVGNLPDVEDTPEGARQAREEAAATVDGYREFRDKPGRPARGKRSGKVQHPAIDADRLPPADGGPGNRHRTRRATRKG